MSERPFHLVEWEERGGMEAAEKAEVNAENRPWPIADSQEGVLIRAPRRASLALNFLSFKPNDRILHGQMACRSGEPPQAY